MIRTAVLLSDGSALPASAVIPSLIGFIVSDVAAARLSLPAVLHATVPPPETVLDTVPQTTKPVEPQTLQARPVHQQPTRTAIVLAVLAERVDFEPQVDQVPTPIAPPIRISLPSRLNGSIWLLVRGGPAGTVSGGQLGASQGGVRLTYALDRRRRFAMAARIAAPLEGRGRESALGIEWQPTRLPIRLIAEHRFVLDGGRGGGTLGVIAGYGPSDIVPGIRLEAYGQAGAIARDAVEGFVDASARLTHPVGKFGGIRVDIGIGAWGSAQRAAERFDIGPSLVATMPIARKTIRLTLDWRERIAGAARPGSGPALSIGSDF